MEIQILDLVKLDKLFEEDVQKYSLDKIKGGIDAKADILKKNNAQSFEYLTKTLFKTKNDVVAYWDEKGFNMTKISEISLMMKAINATVLKAWEKSTIFYTVVQDPKNNLPLDIEKQEINSFPPSAFTPNEKQYEKKINIDLLKKLVFELWGRNNENNIIFIVNYLRWLINSKHTQVIPYLLGEEGHGKTKTIEFLKKIVGSKRSIPVKMKHWASQFNDHLINKFFIYTDETAELTSEIQRAMIGDAMENIKNACTTTETTIECKGKTKFEYKVYPNILISSNFPLNGKNMAGRRFKVFPITNIDIIKPEEFIEIDDIITGHNKDHEKYIQAFVNFIMNHDFKKEYPNFKDFEACNEFQKIELDYDHDFKDEIKQQTAKISHIVLRSFIDKAKLSKDDSYMIEKKVFDDKVAEKAKERNMTVNKSTVLQDLINVGVEKRTGAHNKNFYCFKDKDKLINRLKSHGVYEAEEDQDYERLQKSREDLIEEIETMKDEQQKLLDKLKYYESYMKEKGIK